MKAIGFRIEPKAIHWSIVEGTKEQPLVIADDTLVAPKTYNEAAALTWYKNQVLILLVQYQPESAAIRYPEPTGRGSSSDSSRIRVRIEGVILELLNSQNLIVVTGALKSLSANIGSQAGKIYLSSDEFRGIDWKNHNLNRKEAILVATAALKDKE